MSYILAILIFIGCATTPKWYLKTYQDTNRYIYATGEGKNKQNAINNALSFAASKLQTTIDSTFISTKRLYKTSSKTSFSSITSKQIKAYIKNFHFYNYSLEKISKSDKIYVLLKIDRLKNAKAILNRAKEKLNEIENSLSSDKVIQLKTYPKLIKKLNKIISSLYTAKSFYNLPQIDKTLKTAINLKIKLQKSLNSINFSVKKDFANITKETLSSLNLKIGKNGIKIYSTASTSKNFIQNYFIYLINLKTTLKDKTEYTFSISCGGKSITSFRVAKSFAINECKEKLKEKLNSIIH